MQLPSVPARNSTSHQTANLELKVRRTSRTTMMTIMTAVRARKIQRAKGILSSRPKAAPELWILTSLMTPGIRASEPVARAMFTVTQYLSHWSAISIITAMIAYSISLSFRRQVCLHPPDTAF